MAVFLTETPLSAEERKKLPDSSFGIKDKRQYPLFDQKHVKSAITMFRYCKEEDRKELAKNIKIAADKFGIHIHPDNTINKYL
jgi:hypothetical protein